MPNTLITRRKRRDLKMDELLAHASTRSPASAGRPSHFREEFVRIAEKMCRLGATMPEIADALGVPEAALYRWRNAHPEFAEALKVGRQHADERVEAALYKRAIGYMRKTVKIIAPKDKDGDVIEHEYWEEVQPDTTAQIFWLKNRRPDRWRDVHKIDVNHRFSDLLDEALEKIGVSEQDVIEGRAEEVDE